MNNLGNLKKLKVLHHPYAFNPLFGSDTVDTLKALIEKDQLEELSFEMK